MDGDDCDFPPQKLRKLDEKITSPNWVVPVFPKEELEFLLNASIDLCKRGADVQNEACQRFLGKSLTVAFTKILTSNAVSSWNLHVHNCINGNCERLVDLCIHKMDADSLSLLDLLAMAFDPSSKFNTVNEGKQSASVPPESDIPDEELYARPPAGPENPRGWLVDLINKFGNLGGFVVLHARFQSSRRHLTIPIIRALLRPLGLCHELLTVPTIDRYLLPIVKRVREIFDNLPDTELIKAAENESIIHDISVVIKAITSLALRMPEQKNLLDNLASMRLKITLRLLEIVKNIQQLFDKLILEELDQFLQGFQIAWMTGDTEKREKLLDLIRRLVKDDKDGSVTHKVLTLFWNFAHSDDISTVMMDLALNTHVKILGYSSPQDRNILRTVWLDKCVEELTKNNWTLPALTILRDICKLYNESTPDNDENQYFLTREDVIDRLQDQRRIFSVVANNLAKYIDKVRQLLEENPAIDETIVMPDGRYNHVIQVRERLDSLIFLLDNGLRLIGADELAEIWQCLAVQPVFPSDRETCFKWICELNMERIRIHPTESAKFFNQCVLKFDAKLLTLSGLACFNEFLGDKDIYLFEDLDDSLTMDYLWKVVTKSRLEVAKRAVKHLKIINNTFGSDSKLSNTQICQNFVAECMDRLQTHWKRLSTLTGKFSIEHEDRQEMDDEARKKIAMETREIDQVMNVMREYINDLGWKGIISQLTALNNSDNVSTSPDS